MEQMSPLEKKVAAGMDAADAQKKPSERKQRRRGLAGWLIVLAILGVLSAVCVSEAVRIIDITHRIAFLDQQIKAHEQYTLHSGESPGPDSSLTRLRRTRERLRSQLAPSF